MATTAGTADVSTVSAFIIGLIGDALVVLAVNFFDRVLHNDDPFGAVSAHSVVSLSGTLAVGLFVEERLLGNEGLFFGGGLR